MNIRLAPTIGAPLPRGRRRLPHRLRASGYALCHATARQPPLLILIDAALSSCLSRGVPEPNLWSRIRHIKNAVDTSITSIHAAMKHVLFNLAGVAADERSYRATRGREEE
ncbi:hypothetical protein [Acidocella aminolytica]|nr:hypothetical protein [Acidocella aminolytica]SHF52096.1 hypothetical protein SAMN02746095_03562 [Acidocella aminolytica 101 = DSM 11237]